MGKRKPPVNVTLITKLKNIILSDSDKACILIPDHRAESYARACVAYLQENDLLQPEKKPSLRVAK